MRVAEAQLSQALTNDRLWFGRLFRMAWNARSRELTFHATIDTMGEEDPSCSGAHGVAKLLGRG